jgi:hypothetical protein
MKNKKEYDKLYYQQNKERLKKEALERYNNNTEYYKQKFKESYLTETQEQRDNRKQKTIEYINNNKELVNEKNLEYYHKNKEKLIKQQIKYHKNKYYTDPIFRLRVILSITINQRLKNINVSKSKQSLEVVGLESWNLLKEHIENQWVEGMTWDNYGNKKESWSIDHIIPISSAQTEEDIYILNHYTNLRPMWHVANIKKGNKF